MPEGKYINTSGRRVVPLRETDSGRAYFLTLKWKIHSIPN